MIKEKAISQSQAAAERPSRVMDVLKNRDFLKLWSAQILSQTAQQIVNYALVLQVHRISGSSTAVSGIIIAFTLPAILFAALAGVFVERNSKKTMLTITNVLRGVMVLIWSAQQQYPAQPLQITNFAIALIARFATSIRIVFRPATRCLPSATR